MPEVAHYTVVSDATARLTTGGDIDHEYPPFDLTGAITSERSILTLQLDQASQADLRWSFEINGHQITAPLTRGTFFTAMQEVINAGILKRASNTAKVTLLDGNGQLNVSDVVIHFQRQV
jgi:hypothetical protein